MNVKVKLSKEELFVLDWVLTYPAPAQTLAIEQHMVWQALRLEAWEAILWIEKQHEKLKKKNQAADAPLTEVVIEDAELPVLLAILPTTFRFGTGEDCGYSLKKKIAMAILKAGALLEKGGSRPSDNDVARRLLEEDDDDN